MSAVERTAVLVLNATYEPIHVCGAKRALTLVVKGKAIIEEHEAQFVHIDLHMPSVIRLREYRHVPHRVQVLTRRNVLSRDNNQCQYCAEKFAPAELTLDHVIPRSRGGRSVWENLVACCKICNHRKADQTPEEAGMILLKRPRLMTLHTARSVLRQQGEQDQKWRKYLFYRETQSA